MAIFNFGFVGFHPEVKTVVWRRAVVVREANHTGVGRHAAPIDPKRCNRSLGRAFLARVLFWFGVSTFPNYGIVCTVLRCGTVRGRAITVGVIWEGVFFSAFLLISVCEIMIHCGGGVQTGQLW